MKFDLASFKKTGETESHATFEHPHGHQIQISKKSLNPGLTKQLGQIPLHLADGGAIPYDQLIQQEQAQNTPYGVTDAPQSLPSMSEASELNASAQQSPPTQPAQQVPASGLPNVNPETNNVNLQNIFSQQSQALKDINAGTQAGIKQGQEATQQYVQDTNNAAADHAMHLKDINDDLMQDRAAYMNTQIDPRHVWNSKDGLQKASTLIGLALGGLGSAFTGQENPAMKLLQSQIDQDIESQKLQLGKQHTLYSMNLQKYGNENAAYAATKLQMQNAFGAQMQMAAMKTQSAQAQGNFQLQMGNLQKEMIPNMITLANFQTMKTARNGGIPAGSNAEMMLPEKEQEKMVNIETPNGVMKFPAQTKEDATKFNEAESETKQLMQKINDAKKFINDKGWSPGYLVTDSPDSTEAKNIMEDIQSSIGRLEGINRLSHEDSQIFRGMNTNPGRFNSAAAMVAMNHLGNTVARKQAAAHSAYLSNPASTSTFRPKK